MKRIRSIVSLELTPVSQPIASRRVLKDVCCQGRFDEMPHSLVPQFASKCVIPNATTIVHFANGQITASNKLRKNILALSAAIKSKSSSRGCGPVLWKWALQQPWRF